MKLLPLIPIPARWSLPIYGLLIGFLVLINLTVKPLLAPDETRYLAVAWEMWREGDFLVPRLNGEFYTHKPPFLFWLMHLGWSLFGVVEWWPRLLAPLAFLLDALLLRGLTRQLFPDAPKLGRHAALLFTGTLFPLLFMNQVMFDLWVVLWVLLGLLALVEADRGRSLRRTVLLASLALGMGIVTKGPVLLLYLLPPALAAAHWSRRPKAVLCTGLLGLLGGAALALAWAIPAAIAGGEAYRDAIFWGQTAGRMKDSFDHARPIWWYLPLLPVILFPWIWWPRSFRGWKTLAKTDAPLLRLTFWATVPQFLVFSAISGKQPHYLLPLFPMLLVALARNLSQEQIRPTRYPWLPMLLPGALGCALVTAPWWLEEPRDPVWLHDTGLLFGGGLLLLGALQQGRLAIRMPAQYGLYSFLTACMVGGILFVFYPAFRPVYDLAPLSRQVAAFEQQGIPMAFYGSEYFGQFHYHGRLGQPLANPHEEKGLQRWLEAHPDGLLWQVIRRDEEPTYGYSPYDPMEFGSRRIQVWDAAALHAVLLDRGD